MGLRGVLVVGVMFVEDDVGGLEGDVEEVFFAEFVEGEEVVDFEEAGAGVGFRDLGGEVAAFEADEAGGDG
jgi:hypothetical protein